MSTGGNKDNVTHSLKDEHAPKEGKHNDIAQQLENLIEGTRVEHEAHINLSNQILLSNGEGKKPSAVTKVFNSLLCGLMPTEEELEQDFARWKMGNYIAVRGTDETFFEEMPLYVRVGMHLLFYGSKQKSLLRWGSVERLLKEMSLREGVIYDDSSNPKAVQDFIQNFIKTYKIDTKDLLEPDLTKYKTRNEFFYRKLKPDVRPIADKGNSRLISSAADCRLIVFSSTKSAKDIWIKGKKFSISALINKEGDSTNKMDEACSLAIFRLAPADYHRYNHPVGPAKVVGKSHTGNEYYTVNPDAVNEDFNVFTGNTRDITMMEWTPVKSKSAITYAFVSVGALLVGSNRFTGAEESKTYQRGDEMGFFAYGGSTVIGVYPPEAKIKWDDDLLANSQKGRETYVKVGERIGICEA